MSKQLKDYLHLHLGCELERGGIVTYKLLDAANEAAFDAWTDLKPILRPLSDMTKAEMHECGNMVYDFSDDPELNRWKWSDFDFGAAEQFHYLLSKHFDLFGLIEAGLAIDKTKHTIEK